MVHAVDPDSLFCCLTLAILAGVWVRAGEGRAHGSGDAPSDAPLLALCLAATVVLLLLLYVDRRRGTGLRSVLVAAHRVAVVALVSQTSAYSEVLSAPPRPGLLGFLYDACHIVIGGRVMRLFFLGAGIHPNPGAHLVSHTICLAVSLQHLGATCAQPLLDHALTEQRLDSLHQLLRIPLMGLLPPCFPGGTRERRCAAALAFLCTFVGWLLPTYLVLRAHCRQTQKPQPGSRQQAASVSAALEGSRGVRGCTHCDPARQHQPSSLRFARWAYCNVFMADSPRELQVLAWCALASLSWMAAAVVMGPPA